MLVRLPLDAKILGCDSGSITFSGVDPRLNIVVSDKIAERLASLSSPAEVSALASVEDLGRETVAKLLSAGLLSEVCLPDGEHTRLSSFFPRFLQCPEGVVGEGRISVIGVPSDTLSQTGGGARGGPAALRVASIQLDYAVDSATGLARGWYDCSTDKQVLRDITIVDAGDLEPQLGESIPGFGSRIARAGRICTALGSLPVFLGGDHSISYWAITAIRSASEGPISVLHLDAHSDLTERTAMGVPTNGSVARWLIKENPEMPFVSVGLRGFLGVKQPLLSPVHKHFSAADLIREGPAVVLAALPETMPCYVSFDIDVLDPIVAPGTNVTVPGGLSFEQVREVLIGVGSQRRLAGIDIVELNPERDPYSRSASAAVHLLLSLLGSVFPAPVESVS